MENFFVSYWKIVKRTLKKISKLLELFIPLFLAVITGIYINLFTNQEYLKSFWGIQLTALGDFFFILAFGLVALLALIKSLISLAVITIGMFVINFFLYLLSRVYNFILSWVKANSSILILAIITFVELVLAIILFLTLGDIKGNIGLIYTIKFCGGFTLLYLGAITAQLIDKMIRQIRRRNNRR